MAHLPGMKLGLVTPISVTPTPGPESECLEPISLVASNLQWCASFLLDHLNLERLKTLKWQPLPGLHPCGLNLAAASTLSRHPRNFRERKGISGILGHGRPQKS